MAIHKIDNTHIFGICMISRICVVNSNEDFFLRDEFLKHLSFYFIFQNNSDDGEYHIYIPS